MLRNNLLQITFSLVLLMILFSCNVQNASLENATKTTLTNSETDKRFKASLSKLLNYYYKLQQAIHSENIDEIKKAAFPYIQHLKDLDILILNDQQQLDWNLKSEMIQFSLEEIIKYDELDDIRINFLDLSFSMEDAIKDFGTEKGTVYVFSCKKDEKSNEYKWLSNETNLVNPFGKEFKSCGSIVEQITFE